MISILEARRIALTAQGFARPRPNHVTVRHLEDTIRRIAPLQLDFVNVLVPAHFLIPFSRLGPYRREALHALIYEQTKFTEQWAHEAAVIPIETWPLLKHRMAAHKARPDGFDTVLRRHKQYAGAVLQIVRESGPVAAADLPPPPETAGSLTGSWIGTFERAVLEAQFGQGLLASANRLSNFVRTYDLAERRIPATHFRRDPSPDEARQELLLLAAQAHGIGTARDLADYYRLNIVEAKQSLASMVSAGHLEMVAVEGWPEPAYIDPAAARPKTVRATALLSPFDPLIWFRPRVRRLFGFDYTIEIYTPKAKRKFGYYVLPFLQEERLTARVDLKADRASKTLRVLAAYHEPGEDPATVARPLLAELETLAGWLGLTALSIEPAGNLSARLMAD